MPTMAHRQLVLAATDLGESSDEAIRQAHRWAKETKAGLSVCFVIPPRVREESSYPPAYADDSMAQLELERRAEDVVRDRVRRLTERGDDFDVVIEGGRPDLGIAQLAEELRVSLVVVGNRRSSDVERLLLGSISERVVRYAERSVLVARPSPATNVVLAATDLSDAGLPAVTEAMEVAARRHARLVVLYCIEPPEDDDAPRSPPGSPSLHPSTQERTHLVDGLKHLLASHGVSGDVEVLDGYPGGVIVRRAAELQANLVVVGTRGRTGLARMAFGSVAETVAREAPCSVLAVRLRGASLMPGE